MIKIYYSLFYQDYIFLEDGRVYGLASGTANEFYVWPEHLKNSRRHKDKRDKEVIFIVTIKD
jgi:hypothetical protein